MVFLKLPSTATSAGSALTVTTAPFSVFPKIRNRFPICCGGRTDSSGGLVSLAPVWAGSSSIRKRRTGLQSEEMPLFSIAASRQK